MQITKITIGRLYNLGNYEHIRYELTAEIPPGESPTIAVHGLENILHALNPARPAGVATQGQLAQALSHIRAIRDEWTDEQIASRYGKCRALVVAELEKQYAAACEKTAAWEKAQERARYLLQDLGGAADWKDAKRDWRDDDEF